jgi:DNA (cytosine-5)-methyltransferase 1
MAGYRELLAVEWDDHAVETFKLNFPDVPVWHGDIAELSVEERLRITGLQPGELDVLDGSPPCQGFSTVGKRKMEDGRNQLFREYVRLLRGLKPKVLVMENVSGCPVHPNASRDITALPGTRPCTILVIENIKLIEG